MDGQARGRHRWIFFGALFLFHAAAGVASPLLPRLRQTLGASYLQVGWVNAAFGVTRLLTDVPAGWFLRRRPPTLLVFLGMGIVACGNLVAASAGSIDGVIAGRAVAGFGYSAAVIGILTLLATLATDAGRARVFSLYEFLIVAGLAVSTAVAGVAAEWVSWRAGFVAGASLALVGLGGAILALPRRVMAGAGAPPSSQGRPRVMGVCAGSPRWRIGLVLLVSFALSYAWTGLFYTLYPLYGGERLALGTGTVGVAMSAGYVSDLALLFPYGWLADRHGRVPVLLAGILVVAGTAFLLPLGGSHVSYVVVGVMTGVGFACWGLPPALLTDWVPTDSRGLIMGMYRFMVDLGFVLGPWSVSLALEAGGFRMAAWGVAALTAASALACLGLRRQPAPLTPKGKGAATHPLREHR